MPATIATRPAAAPGRRRERPARTVLQIARAEGRRLLRHPIVVVGLLLAVVTPWDLLHELAPVMVRDTVLLTGTGTLIAVSTLLAAHLATTRPQRDGTEDLYEASPTQVAARTGGLLLACLWPAAAALAYGLAGVGYLYWTGGIGHPNPFDVLAIPAATATAGVAGVALGRWLPSRIAATLSAVVLVTLQAALLFPWFHGGPHLVRLMVHSDWGMSVAPELVPRAPGIHLVYVLGVAGLIAGTAFLRHGGRPGGRALVAAGLAVAVLSGGWLARPLPDEQVHELVSLVIDPSDSLECGTRGNVDYCVLPRYTPWIPRWHDTVGGVLAAAPETRSAEHLRVKMSLEDGADNLHEIVNLGPDQVSRLWAAEPSRNPAPIRVGTTLGGYTGNMETYALALNVSSLVLQIGKPVVVQLPDPDADNPVPPEEVDSHIRCTTAGQAREVVALYLAAHASPDAERGFRHHLVEQPYGLDDESADPKLWRDRLNLQPRFVDSARNRHETQDASWSLAGATLAAQLLDRPASEVLRRLHREWEHWTDPSTSREELVRRFDLQPPPAIERVAAQAGVDISGLDRDTTEGAEPCP